jgi:hypothetical protein
VGDNPLYLSIDIDVLDPAHAPGTGTRRPAASPPGSCSASCGASPACDWWARTWSRWPPPTTTPR